VIVSVLLHLALLLVPGHIFDIFFPREKPTLKEGRTTDPWPGFSEIVMVVVPLEEEAEARAPVVVELDQPDVAPTPISETPAASGHLPGEPGIAHGEIPPGDIEPQFFPPIPRFIVPPSLEDLGIAALTVNVRILVTASGLPERVVLEDALADPEVRRRILDCAQRFRFEPARLGDTPVSSWIDLPLVMESAGAR
jgi:hypothetical protein